MTNLVNFKIYGEQNPKPLYILHGIFGMLDNWHLAAKQLSVTHRIVSFDARNHGKSFHCEENSYTDMANDLLQLMQHLGDDSAIIMGHSMGGKTAMTFAELYPENVEQLIVVDIAPKRYTPSHHNYFKAFREVDLSKVSSRKEAEEAFLAYAPEMGVRQFLLKNIEPVTGGGYLIKSNLLAIENHYDEIIGGLHFSSPFLKKTDFIAGSKSKYIMESDKDEILKYFPKAQFRVIENAGHWVHADNLSGFINCLKYIIL